MPCHQSTNADGVPHTQVISKNMVKLCATCDAMLMPSISDPVSTDLGDGSDVKQVQRDECDAVYVEVTFVQQCPRCGL